MGSREVQRENAHPTRGASSKEERHAIELKHDIAKLIEQIEKIVTDNHDAGNYIHGTEAPPIERTEASSYITNAFVQSSMETVVSSHERTDTRPTTSPDKRLTAYIDGTMKLSYLRGLLERKRSNADASILHFTRCCDLATRARSSEYMVKSQAQLADLYFERFQKHGLEIDRRLALHYSTSLFKTG
ncbi:MAG: hypothetical protein ACFFER_15385 [Candidatus Thorarchaeota archaeon]